MIGRLKLSLLFVFVHSSLDDITQPVEEHQVCNSFKSLNSEAVFIPKESAIQEQSRASQNAIEQSLCKNAISGSSGLAERGKGS